MWQEEHFSKYAHSERLMMDFREVLSHCDLHDIGFIGAPWNFDNKRKGDQNVKVRLDRAVASPSWSTLFSGHRPCHIISSRSEHCPILLTADEASGCRSYKPIRRYEVVWEREPSLAAAVEEAWSRRIPGSGLGAIEESLNDIMKNLQRWRKTHFKSIPKELERKRDMLAVLRPLTDDASVAARIGLEKEMDELFYIEEIMWMQRSRVAWLREGDRNTKYFHRRASWRRRKNRIRRLKREDGTWTSDTGEMENMTRDFFQKLYTQEDFIQPAPVIDTMRSCIDA
jgi:type II secretory pathway component PulJ